MCQLTADLVLSMQYSTTAWPDRSLQQHIENYCLICLYSCMVLGTFRMGTYRRCVSP